MEGPKRYLRCPCTHCGQAVEYPDYAAGGMTICPNCGKTTKTVNSGGPAPISPQSPKATGVAQIATSAPPSRASISAPPPATAPARRAKESRVPVLILAAVLAGVVAVLACIHGGFFQFKSTQQTPAILRSNAVPSPPPGSNLVPLQTNPTAPITTEVKSAKSTNDFKIKELAVQHPKGTKGSKITYIIGVVENASDEQRFGVKIELDLLDASGDKIDSASDYCDTLNARQTWAFRAQAHDPRSVQARVASIKEDN